jgi:hypothetical protein
VVTGTVDATTVVTGGTLRGSSSSTTTNVTPTIVPETAEQSERKMSGCI